jgi:hypothetical protein
VEPSDSTTKDCHEQPHKRMNCYLCIEENKKLINGARKNRVLDGDGVNVALVVEVDVINTEETTTYASIQCETDHNQ